MSGPGAVDNRGKLEVSLAAGAVPDPATLGAPVPLTATITNTGLVTLGDVSSALATLEQGTDPGQYSVDCSSITELAPNASGECAITYYLTNNDLESGSFSVTGTAAAKTIMGVTVTASDSAPVTETFDIPGNITATGSASLNGQPYKEGSEVTFTVTVTNGGQTTVHNIAVAENSFTGTGNTLSAFTCTPEEIDSGEQAECVATYTLTQADVDNAFTSTPGPLDLTVTVSADTGPNNDDPMSKIISVGPIREPLGGQPNASLIITGKDPTMSPAEFKAEENVEFTFQVENNGVVTLDPTTVTLANISGTGDYSDASCEPALASLAPGVNTSCSLNYTLTQADVDSGEVTATLSVEGDYGVGNKAIGNATDVLQVTPIGEVALKKTVSAPTEGGFAAGPKLGYTFEVTNKGNATLTDIELTETDFSGAAGAPKISCPEGSTDSLAPSNSIKCSASYSLTQEDVNSLKVSNTASVSGSYFNGTLTASAEDSALYTGVASNGISVVQTVSNLESPVAAGAELDYTFVVTNTGALTLSDWKVESTDFTGSNPFGQITCLATPEVLEPAESVTCTASYAITQQDLGEGSVSSTVAASANSSEGVVNDESTVVSKYTASAGISLVKTAKLASATDFRAGGDVEFTFSVTNTGTLDITDGTIVEDPAFTGTGNLELTDCKVPTPLEPAATYTCQATYELTQADVDNGGVTNTATASGTYDHDGNYKTATDASTIALTGTGASALELKKSALAPAAGKFLPGANVDFTFDVTNTGVTTLKNVAVSEDDFSGTGTLSPLTCGGNNTLAPGGTLQCTANYQVTQDDVNAEVLTNSASVKGTTLNDKVDVTDKSSITINPVGIVSSVEITNIISPDKGEKLVVGSPVKDTLGITNTGDTTLVNVDVTSTVKPGANAKPVMSRANTIADGVTVEPVCVDAPAQLAPGESFECTVAYKVTEADIAAGGLTNTGAVSAQNMVGTEVSDAASAQLTGLVVPAKKKPESSGGIASTGASSGALILALLVLPVGAALIFANRRGGNGNARQ